MSADNPAETYEAYMVPALFAPWAEQSVLAAKPMPAERSLDVACGTGVVARQIARAASGGEVTAIDINPNMLAVARAAAEREKLAISWQEGRAEHLPFQDRSFDLVVCQFALMFFADRSAALAEMHRVLTDQGRLVLSVWQGLDCHPFYRALDEVIDKRLGASSLRDIFALGDHAELHALLAAAGFREVQIEPRSMTARFGNPESFLAGEIDVDTAAIPAMQHLDAAARGRMTDAIREDMHAALRERIEGDHVVLPFHALIARARK